MTFEDARSDLFDPDAVGDVALLVLVCLRRRARQPDDVCPALLERADQLGADAGGRAGDDCYRQTLTLRPAEDLRPDASRTVAVSRCLPFLSPAVL